jgi:hypothetical protein
MGSLIERTAIYLRGVDNGLLPFSSLFWRIWTPPIGRGERYHFENFFDGYDGDMLWSIVPPFLGNRRLLPILKKIPYLEVEHVRRPWEEMPAEQREQRKEFIIESTMAAYHSDRAFYTRDAIHQLEEQLQATERPRNRPEWRHRLLDRCWTPNRAWVKITDLDGIVHHRCVWIPGIVTRDGDGHASRNGRTHIRFRTIQELTMPDPDPDPDPACEPFVSDQ